MVINKNPMNPPPLCLYELRFRAISPINNLPFYYGPQLSALFRYLIKPHLSGGSTLSSTCITFEPVETGIEAFYEGDTFNLGISFPLDQLSVFNSIIDVLSGRKKTEILPHEPYFVPGENILLEDIMCRVSGKTGLPSDPKTITYETIRDEIELLKNIEEFSLVFYTPLRLTRPQDYKAEGHRYCDEDFFLSPNKGQNPLIHVISSIKKRLIRYKTHISDDLNGETVESINLPLRIVDGALIWIDCPYGYKTVKTIGGVMGTIKISGRCTDDLAQTLVTGQYTHIGKNTTFGFGAYKIPEIETAKKIKPLSRGRTLLDRATAIESLKYALSRLPNSSPGADGITLSDIKKVQDTYLLHLRESILSSAYVQGELKRYRIPKESGGYRDIYVQYVSDRIIHKAIADLLTPVIDKLLHSSAWAYRRGLNRKGAAEALKNAIGDGYTEGIKADIATFFDSVNLEKLYFILDGLFPFEPLTETIKDLIGHFTAKNIKGLPQGSPLSPVLSNLYLTRFDMDMEKEGFRLIRYCDDFVILSKDSVSKETFIERINNSLSRLDLNLKQEKVFDVNAERPINFLGYLISGDFISEGSKEEKKQAEEEWAPIFKDVWHDGYPVYLTILTKGAFSSGPDLVIKLEGETTETIP
ncbi:MAG TPA: reverse transcriptase domain-containing protein [Syntrophorhabdaceae bacterium]|nr:reverse transcriptase domain-containing protein [Syntrophorhabdaceae bacterium]